jgi:hypothetical protein
MQNGDFSEIRAILKNVAILQDQQAKMLLKHSETLAEHDERMKRIDGYIEVLAKGTGDRLAEIDERLDRVGRHLEVLASICDDLIRNKADRKRRQ